jgi:hypothetical protein
MNWLAYFSGSNAQSYCNQSKRKRLSSKRPYKPGVTAIGGIGEYGVLNEFENPLTTVLLNLTMIQHQSFDVYIMYSSSLSVPLMAGPLWPGYFFVQRWAGPHANV